MNKILRRHTSPLLSGIVVLACLQSCSSDSTEAQEQYEPVVFSLQLAHAAPCITRSTFDGRWPDNTQISISDGANTYVYQTASNSSSLSSGAAAPLTPVSDWFYWKVSTSSKQFTAWYPSGTRATGLTVNADQRAASVSDADYARYDLLYCPSTNASYHDAVPLVFHHQATRIVVTVNTSYTEGHEETVGSETITKKEEVASVVFGGGALGLAGTISTLSTTGDNGTTAWSITDTQDKSVTMRVQEAQTDASNNFYAFECILPPQSGGTASTSLVVIHTTGAVDHELQPVARTYTLRQAFNFQSGYQYEFSLTISEQGTVTLDHVKVDDWNSNIVPVNNSAVIPNNSYPGVN